MHGEMTIGELSDAAGLSRRSVRFYVQQKLLPPPSGDGRGAKYDSSHLKRLRRIGELQAGGYSLEGIRRVLDGEEAAPAALPVVESAGKWKAEVWTRVGVVEGVELHFESTRRQLDVGQLAEIRRAVLRIVGRSTETDQGA